MATSPMQSLTKMRDGEGLDLIYNLLGAVHPPTICFGSRVEFTTVVGFIGLNVIGKQRVQ